MENNQGGAARSPIDIDAITNIDTARMALRWALERLRKFERDNAEVAERATAAEKDKAKAQEEAAALRRSLEVRAQEAEQKALYYAKLEEFLSLQLEGKLDPAALARRELELEELQRAFEKARVDSEKAFAARKAALESEHRKLSEEIQRERGARLRELERHFESRRAALEREHVTKLSELHEKEIALRSDEKSLAERKAEFERYYSDQRDQLQAQVRNFREEIEGQVKLKAESAQRLFDERLSSLESSWSSERALLVRELESWKQKAQELAARLPDLERELALSEEAEKRARNESDRKTLAHEQDRRAWERMQEALTVELEEWRQKAQEALPRLFDLEKRLAAAQQALNPPPPPPPPKP